MGEMRRSGEGAGGPAKGVRVTVALRRSAAAGRGVVQAGLRAATVTWAMPRARAAARAEQAVAPAPRMRTSAPGGRKAAVTPWAAMAAIMPGTSVLWPWRRPAAKTTVFAAPTSEARG